MPENYLLEELEEGIFALGKHNPTIQACLKLYSQGYRSWEETLSVIIFLLNAQLTDTIKYITDSGNAEWIKNNKLFSKPLAFVNGDKQNGAKMA